MIAKADSLMAWFIIFLAMLGGPKLAHADLWAGFYEPARKKNVEVEQFPRSSNCIDAILRAQQKFSIPDNLLLAIGIQEAGRKINGDITVWPWAVNAEGHGVYFRSRDQAIGWVKAQQNQGVRSIDVGCMQINLRWHKGAFDSLEDAFDPDANATYAARFLSELRRSEGSWWHAAGSYHSKTDVHRERYLSSLLRNQRVANAHVTSFPERAQTVESAVGTVRADAHRRPDVLWGRARDETSAFSIYSRQPILPIFEEGR